MAKLDLKIKTIEVDGHQCIDPETLKLLVEFGEHRRVCEECERFFVGQGGRGYCATGTGLLNQLLERPDVSTTPS